MADPFDVHALVLRAIKYGDHDVIAHLFTPHDGCVSVFARGVRRASSKMGGRIEPCSMVTLKVAQGKGDLLLLRSVERVQFFERIRTSWTHQQVAASVLDVLRQTGMQREESSAVYASANQFLVDLDKLDRGDGHEARWLLASWTMQFANLAGFGPQFDCCVRCGSVQHLTGWALQEGGVVCAECHGEVDRSIDPKTLDIARACASSGLTNSPVEIPGMVVGSLERQIIAPHLDRHAGIRFRCGVRWAESNPTLHVGVGPGTSDRATRAGDS